MPRRFLDRRDAGRQLAARLRSYTGVPGGLVFGLARGSVPVAYEVAHALGAPLDVLYRGERPPLEVQGSVVIMVDDGMATGATMQAAVEALRAHRPRSIVVAVPVASEQACAASTSAADVCMCLTVPPEVHAVGAAYADFGQTTDDEVRLRPEEATRHLPEDAGHGAGRSAGRQPATRGAG
ncbi:MAG: phosphoribosyltransferase [Gemmatimonadetes bacterium]|nr:phosphoribosyltransferase [Gemmatimonadota bacterium]